MATPNTYSFSNVNGSLVDQSGGGSFSFGGGTSGIAAEGVTVAMNEEKATMTIGADGTPMHSLHSSRGGRVVIRLLKTSPQNAIMDQIYRSTTANGAANYGQIVVTINDLVRGDQIVGSQAGIAKRSDLTYANEGGVNEWTLNVGILDWTLGNGTPA